MQTVMTDVLVIGGGSAGMRAALSAREAGAEVALAYKSGGNCTSMAAGSFAAVMPGAQDDSLEEYYDNTLKAGRGLGDPHLVRVLVERGGEVLNTLMSWGVKFYTHEDGSLKRFRSGGHSRERVYRCPDGKIGQFFKTLSHRMLDAGVRPLRNCQVLELLLDNGRVCGACGADSEGRPLLIRAKAVILASGGFAGTYKNTSGPKAIAGEGLEMAYEAGGALKGLEFVQFMPTGLAYPPQLAGRPVSDPLRGAGAVLRDASGERFMHKYDPIYGDVAGRDIVSIAIVTEVAQGRGTPHGGAYLDATALEPQKIMESYGGVGRLQQLGIDPCTQMLEVTPAAHFSCGGIAIDAQGFTGVDGLYAAGEVCAGIHGANRLGASALPETLVFGDIAGKSAALFAQKTPGGNGAPSETFSRLVRDSAPDRPLSGSLNEHAARVRALFWDGIGVVRSEESLADAEKDLSGIAEELSRASCALCSFSENLERELLAKTARLGCKAAYAARQRRESRGTHYRSDFPHTSEEFNRHIEFRKNGV